MKKWKNKNEKIKMKNEKWKMKIGKNVKKKIKDNYLNFWVETDATRRDFYSSSRVGPGQQGRWVWSEHACIDDGVITCITA